MSTLAPILRRRLRAEAWLAATTILWASSFPAMKWLLDERGTSPWVIVIFRDGLAALCVLLWRPRCLRLRGHLREWRDGAWLGVFMMIGMIFQVVGLETTTAARSAFITALFVVFVPILQTLHLRRPPGRGALVGVAIAVAGLSVMTRPWQGALVIGDLLTLVCAVGWSLYITELQRVAPRCDLARLLFSQFLTVTVLSAAGLVITGSLGEIRGAVDWTMLIYLGALVTFFSTLIHNRFQRDTTPTRAALIFTLEPVFAAVIAWIAIHEAMEPHEIVGAGLILAGILFTESH